MNWKRIFLADKTEITSHKDEIDHVHDPEKPMQAILFVDPKLKQQIIDSFRNHPLTRSMSDSAREEAEAELVQSLEDSKDTGIPAITAPWNAWQENENQVGPVAEQIKQPKTWNEVQPKSKPNQPALPGHEDPKKKRTDGETFPGYL